MARVAGIKQKRKQTAALTWTKNTELLGLMLEVQPEQDWVFPPQYVTELHSWFLDQVRRMDFELSSYLHDGQSEKAFTVSDLSGNLVSQGRSLLLPADQTYQWTITALSQQVVAWMHDWLQSPPSRIELRSGTLNIVNWSIAHPATTYEQLFQTPVPDPPTLNLTFLSPTSFRHRGNHLPLPVPENILHSYLRRWNDFSDNPFDQEDFLDWVDESVIILRHQIQSAKVVAGKKGSVTGFTGAIQLGLTAKGQQEPDYVQLFMALGQLAPYCGTGHKTTFGLGQTRLGWFPTETIAPTATIQDLLATRIAELTDVFMAQRKRTGGDRATQIAETWATILARRELGESLQAIAQDLELPYETAKSYVKLARRSLKER